MTVYNRYYDQDIKRFINRDVVSGDLQNSQSLNRYAYVQGNPVSQTDPFGLCPDSYSIFHNFQKFMGAVDWTGGGHMVLNIVGCCFDGADLINTVWYALEGNWKEAGTSLLCSLPGMGMTAGVKLMQKGGKLARLGRNIAVISRFTMCGIAIGTGGKLGWDGFKQFFKGLSEGNFDPGALVQGIAGTALALSGAGGLYHTARGISARIGTSERMGGAGETTGGIGGWLKEKGSQLKKGVRSFMADNRGCVDLDAFKSGSKIRLDKAKNVANQVKARKGAALPGYKGGRTFKNIPLEDGAQKLPEGITYKEYDVNPYIKGKNRGTERIVIGDDDSVWYTDDHYKTFTKIE